jgi:hypothetical protein
LAGYPDRICRSIIVRLQIELYRISPANFLRIDGQSRHSKLRAASASPPT